MTTDEAIRILDPETTVEAIAEIEYYAGFSGATAKVQAVSRACELAVAALRAQQDPKVVETDHVKNDPLTLDELREMDGEPVWVFQPQGLIRPFWGMVDAEDESIANVRYCAMFEDYGDEWLAYRHKPKEG